MADGFEKAFQAFLEKQQSSEPISDENNNTDDEEDSNEEYFSSESEGVPETKKLRIIPPKPSTVPILRLRVHPDYSADKGYSPFSLKHYIKSPTTERQLISYDRGVHTSNSNNHLNNNRTDSHSETYLQSNSTYEAYKNIEKVNSLNKLVPSTRKGCRSIDLTKSRITYQKQILLKKYGLLYPGRKSKTNTKSSLPSSPTVSQNIILGPLLAEDRLNSSVPKTECDSHYFCQQGEGLSRNSPEAAKSVISSPANASAGENSLTDPCVSPMCDSITEQATIIINESSDLKNSTSNSIKNHENTLSKGDNYIITSQHESPNTTDIILSLHSSNNLIKKSNREPRKITNHSTKRKRQCSGYKFDPDYIADDTGTEDESFVEPVTSRRKRLRQKQNTLCLCCGKENYTRTRSLTCNTSNYNHLSLNSQNFIYHSIHQSNIKNKLHTLFCCVFPKLIPILHSISPESPAFVHLIEEMLHTLQSSEEEIFNVNTGNVINLLRDMNLRNESKEIPVFQPHVILCQNPELCFSSFRDKVVHLLQLLLPSLVVSLDEFLSTTKEFELFLDKVILSNSM